MVTDTPAEPSVLNVKSEDDFLHDQAQGMRASVYELLGRLLAYEPDQEVLDILMKQSALKTDVESVGHEYIDLFIGVGRGELVPFGSWYITGFLMEKPLAVLRTDLATLGIERQQEVKESEDHIAALCDAMAIIIRSGSEVSFSRQQAFYKDHIEPWVGTFFKDLQEAKAAHFYRSVGFFGEGFFDFESRLLAMKS